LGQPRRCCPGTAPVAPPAAQALLLRVRQRKDGRLPEQWHVP
jgi:hypothetical protein